MSKDQKKTVNKHVKIVDKSTIEEWEHHMSQISGTLRFWGLDKSWPGNLIQDVIEEIDKEMMSILK